MAIGYASVCALIFLWQNRLIFHPSPIIQTTPAFFKLEYQEVWLEVPAFRRFGFLSFPVKKISSLFSFVKRSSLEEAMTDEKNEGNEGDNSGKTERIHCWWIPASGQEAGVILYFHGNGINMGANISHACRFHQLGFSILLVDYRGYGRSEGSFPTESSVYQDAQAAWNYLVRARGVPAEQIFIYGHSLGGAIAIDLAVQHPEAAGLIVESSFTSIRQMAAYRGNFWMFPAGLLVNQHFDSITKVRSLQIPVLFMHGTADIVVPYQMSQMLFAAAEEPKHLVLFPEAGHNDVADVVGSQYLEAVQNFVQLVWTRQTQLTTPHSCS